MNANKLVSLVSEHESTSLSYEQAADCVESALPADESVSGWVTGPDAVFTRTGDEYVLNKQALSERVEDYTHITTDYPDSLLNREQWVLQSEKMPRDPTAGHLYPASWGSDTPREERPLHTFNEARNWLQMCDSMMLDTPEGVSTDDLALGYILPHEPPADNSERVVFVDLDDVRDPRTGEIHPTAQEIVEELDTYTEVSQSGEGLHCLLFGALPTHLGQVIADIDSDPYVGDKPPAVEIYDSARYCSITADVLHDKPIRDGQDALETIIDDYTDEQVEEETDDSEVVENFISSPSGDSSSSDKNKNMYYSVAVGELPGVPRSGRCDHPIHGSNAGGNFTTSGGWYCFRHDASGSALAFIAMAEGIRSCDWFADNAVSDLSRDELLKVCLHARDSYNFKDDWNPPLKALESIASDLCLDDASTHYETLLLVYDDYDVSDV